ncbi:hypothetical protein M0R45_037344 [Rubus argutus]|uniref:Uncharacterized protein n=1 Tax=Rubus argutus TaxID=59490 RepID=A0AAW1W0C2_RUBAR
MEARLSARNVNVTISHSLTNPRSLATWEKLKARPGHGRPIKAGTVCHFWDKERPKYAWLPEGWLAEQRRMPSSRLYTYYYDESARQYTRRDEAKKKAGVPVAVKNHASRHIEQGESSQNGRAMNDDINTHYFFWNKNSWATVYKLKARPGHGKHRKAGTKIYFVDRGCPGYRWLPEGWLAEVRRMASNRFYTYYYDRSARLYNTRNKAYEKASEDPTLELLVI